MLIYEVNAVADENVAHEYESWLHGHIHEMLGLGVFEKAALYRVESEEPGVKRWSAHYYAADCERLETYFTKHAERMRRDGQERFGDRVKLDRRILEEERN